MIDMTKLTSYLEAAAHQRADQRRPPEPFITISRQAGAGGRSLAQAVLTAMEADGRPLFRGWKIFDEELCDIVARDPKLSVLLEELVDERFRRGLTDYLAPALGGLSPQIMVFHKTFDVIRRLALGGRAIIVGRGGACAAKDLPSGIHLRLAAAKTHRRESLMKRYALSRLEAERKMAELEESRRRLVRTYFGKDIDDPLLYDATLNMSRLSLDEAACLTLQLTARRAERASCSLA